MFAAKDRYVDRYVQVSEPARVSCLNELVEFVKSRLPKAEDEALGATAKRGYVCPALAREAVEAIKSLPPGEDPANYVLMSRTDLMERPSFVWDLRKGEPPKTGSRSTVPHFRVALAPGLDYFLMFTQQGPSEPLVGGGWGNLYYSESECQKTRKKIGRLLGPDWYEYKVRRTPNCQGQGQALAVVWHSKTASEVGIGFLLAGQGNVYRMPPVLEKMAQGVTFFNVLDRYYDRLRPGCIREDGEDGQVWQCS